MLNLVFESLFFFALFWQTLETYDIAPSFLKDSNVIRSICHLRVGLILLYLIEPNTLSIIGLILSQIYDFKKFGKPLNGASDSMTLILLSGLAFAAMVPAKKEWALYFIITHVCLSYFLAGLVKLREPLWRSGESLMTFLSLPKYASSPTSRWLLQKHPRLSLGASWAVILFELLFPLVVISGSAHIFFLCFGALFHLANYLTFGLNRFFWIWISTYPLIIQLNR